MEIVRIKVSEVMVFYGLRFFFRIGGLFGVVVVLLVVYGVYGKLKIILYKVFVILLGFK